MKTNNITAKYVAEKLQYKMINRKQIKTFTKIKIKKKNEYENFFFMFFVPLIRTCIFCEGIFNTSNAIPNMQVSSSFFEYTVLIENESLLHCYGALH